MSSVKRNTAYNAGGALLPLLATFFTLPPYLETIGEERYGILVILWTVLGYFGLFDLGLGRAVTNRIALFRDRRPEEREDVFWTALLMNVTLGIVGALLLWGVGIAIFDRFIQVPGELGAEVRDALPWMVAAFPLLLTNSVLSGALAGREEFLAQNVVRVVTGILVQVVPLFVALESGPALPALVIAVTLVRVLNAFTLFVICSVRLPVRMRPRLARGHVRPLFSFGGWITVTGIVGPLLSTIDRILVGAVAGAGAVTHYSVPYNLASRITVLPGSLSTALFPRFSSMGDVDRDELMDGAVRSLIVLLTPLIVGGMLLMHPFLAWWVDAEFASRAAAIGEIFAIGLWANCLAYIPFSSIQARGRPDVTAKFHLLEVVPYLLLLWLALEWKGAVGAALAWSVRVWVDALLLFNYAGWRRVRVLAGAVIAVAAGVVAVILIPASGWGWLGVRALVVAAVIFWAWSAAPGPVRRAAEVILARVGHREL